MRRSKRRWDTSNPQVNKVNDVEAVDEFLAFLYRQIDWRDPHHPRYALIWKQIERTLEAKTLVYLTSRPYMLTVSAVELNVPQCVCGCYSGGCGRPEGCRCDSTCPCGAAGKPLLPPPLRSQADAALDALPKALENNDKLRKALVAIATNQLKRTTNRNATYTAGVKHGLAIAADMALRALGEIPE